MPAAQAELAGALPSHLVRSEQFYGRLSVIGFVLVVVAVLLSVYFGITGMVAVDRADAELDRNAEIRRLLGTILSELQDAETGQRGFLLTGAEAYLQPYQVARSRLPADLGHVRDLLVGDPAAVKELRELEIAAGAKLDELEMTVELRRNQGLPAALEVVNQGHGKALMDGMRARIATLQAGETRRVEEAEKRSVHARRAALISAGAAGVLALVLCALLFWLARRYVTARDIVRNSLFVERERFRTTIASIGDGVITTDEKGHVRYLNRIAEDLCGWKSEEAEGRSLEDVFKIINETTREVTSNPAIRALRQGQAVRLDNHTLLIARDGSETPIADSAAPIRDEDGTIHGSILVFHSVAERKAVERVRADEQRRKDEFLATLAHELRNPLAPLANTLQIARRSGWAAVSNERMLAMLERQIGIMTRLVDDLLDVARIAQGRLQLTSRVVDAAHIVNDALAMVEPLVADNGQRIEVKGPGEILHLRGDPARLTQLLVNLLGNASKYSPRGGLITLSISRHDGSVRFAVRDQGIGIAPEMLDAIFEMFSQVDRSLERSRSGLGIGLTLARHIARSHGGTLTAHSAGLGQGSEFVAELPIVERAPKDLTEEANAGGTNGADDAQRSLQILIADDNIDSADSLGMLLRESGHHVYLASSGRQALEICEEVHPDVVLLDIGMPGMNGYEVANALRRRPWAQHTVLVAVTGWGQEEDRRRSREAGFDAHLTKPLELRGLEETLANLVRTARA